MCWSRNEDASPSRSPAPSDNVHFSFVACLVFCNINVSTTRISKKTKSSKGYEGRSLRLYLFLPQNVSLLHCAPAAAKRNYANNPAETTTLRRETPVTPISTYRRHLLALSFLKLRLPPRRCPCLSASAPAAAFVSKKESACWTFPTRCCSETSPTPRPSRVTQSPNTL